MVKGKTIGLQLPPQKTTGNRSRHQRNQGWEASPKIRFCYHYVRFSFIPVAHAPAFLQGSGTAILRDAVGVLAWNEGLSRYAGTGR